MYNVTMKLRQVKKYIKKFPFLYRTVIVFATLLGLGIFIVLFFNKRPVRQTLTNQNQTEGVSFNTFWTKLQENSTDFLQGSDLYIANIESVNVANFNKSKGQSALWQATIVRCEQFLSQQEGNQGNLNCLGQSAEAMLADPKITGMPGELVVSPNEVPFARNVVKASVIKIGAEQAEQSINQSNRYKYQNNDDFYYKLMVDPLTTTPLWQITRRCSLSSKQDKSCDSSSEWSIKVNANNGQLL